MKSITDVSSSTPRAQTARGIKPHAAPKKSKGGSYLDLFTLNIEKAKLSQELLNIEKHQVRSTTTKESIQTRLSQIEKQIQVTSERLRENQSKKENVKPSKTISPSKKWRVLSADY